MARTTVDLFRAGNASRARLDHLRNSEVTVYTDGACNEICVRASLTEGVSCHDSAAAAAAGASGKIWRLPANSFYDETKLSLFPDYPGSDHWNLAPASDMPGSQFIAELRALEKFFV